MSAFIYFFKLENKLYPLYLMLVLYFISSEFKSIPITLRSCCFVLSNSPPPPTKYSEIIYLTNVFFWTILLCCSVETTLLQTELLKQIFFNLILKICLWELLGLSSASEFSFSFAHKEFQKHKALRHTVYNVICTIALGLDKTKVKGTNCSSFETAVNPRSAKCAIDLCTGGWSIFKSCLWPFTFSEMPN